MSVPPDPIKKYGGNAVFAVMNGRLLLIADSVEADAQFAAKGCAVYFRLCCVSTNGTLLNDDYIKLFDRKRNLLPVHF